MSVASTYFLSRMHARPVRTLRGNAIIRRDPREIPRRLRGLLLAVDGRQTVRTYVERLEGFGDIQELLWELGTLGLIELHSNGRSSSSRDEGTDGFTDPSLSSVPANPLLEDPKQLFQTFAQSTLPGEFDDLVRVAQLDDRSYTPPAPAPEPPPQAEVQRQVDSLFALVESLRDERRTLKDQLALARKYRDRARRAESDKLQLAGLVRKLAISCGVLGVMCVVTLLALLRK